MGDANLIRTIGDYSKPSHEGYRNSIELPVGNNVDSLDIDGENRERTRLRLFQFSLRDQASNWLERLPAESTTTWEDITTHLLAQFFPPGRIVKLRNDNLMFQQHHGESLSEAWTRFKDLLQKFPHHGPDLWLQIQILYDHVDYTTQMGIDYVAGGRLRKLRPNEAWATIKKYDPQHLGITFRLGGEQREMSLLEFGSRVGLYTEQQSRDRATLSGLSWAKMVKANLMLLEFWPTIGDGGFIVGNTKVKSIRDPKARLAYRCIATTISGRKESTHRVIEIDLYYLYCIYTNAVVCNIPYWLAKYLKSVGDKNLIYGGMFVTRIAWSFGVLTGEMMNALSVEPPPHLFKKKSLIVMGVIMELHNKECCWPETRETVVEEEDEGDNEGNEAAEGYVGHEGVGGSADIYRNMSQ
ncbi:zinc finger, CCHC-type containing protein [Tanacetum coccineum]